MNYPINIEGFEGQTLEMKPSGMWAGPQLLVNGQPAPKGPKRGQMLLRRTDGSEAVATWKPQFMGLDVPRLDVDGKQINVVEPLKWYAWVWSGLPIFSSLSAAPWAHSLALSLLASILRSFDHPATPVSSSS